MAVSVKRAHLPLCPQEKSCQKKPFSIPATARSETCEVAVLFSYSLSVTRDTRRTQCPSQEAAHEHKLLRSPENTTFQQHAKPLWLFPFYNNFKKQGQNGNTVQKGKFLLCHLRKEKYILKRLCVW